MSIMRALLVWTRTLRVVLTVVVLAFLPMAEVVHAMPEAQAMQMQGMDMPASHHHHGDVGACRVLCLGWVETARVTKPALPAMPVIAVVQSAPADLTSGLNHAPQRRPPKSAIFV